MVPCPPLQVCGSLIQSDCEKDITVDKIRKTAMVKVFMGLSFNSYKIQIRKTIK
jgi:hypothetical protein